MSTVVHANPPRRLQIVGLHVHLVDLRAHERKGSGVVCYSKWGLLLFLYSDKHEYDQATWSTRKWLSWVVQKVSVALHHAAALEVAHALGLSAAVDERA